MPLNEQLRGTVRTDRRMKGAERMLPNEGITRGIDTSMTHGTVGSKLVDVIGAFALCAFASQASACALPSIPLISAQVGVQADQLRAQTGVYFNGMRAYSTC